MFQAFNPNEWCLKNGLHSWGLNSGPLRHESSALTTRPQLLAYTLLLIRLLIFMKYFCLLLLFYFYYELIGLCLKIDHNKKLFNFDLK